jgi:hypothetical protein
MKNAVIGVLHPIAVDYFDKYLSSINKQSYRDFKLFIFGHKIKPENIKYLFEKYDDLDIKYKELDYNLSLSRSRQKVLDYLKEEKYDTCIFTDTDDFYHKDYVKNIFKNLSNKTYDIVFTDLSIFFSKENRIDDYFKKCGIPDEINLEYIIDKNCIGLGHSGINLDVYEKNRYIFTDELIAVDWWLFSVLMAVYNCKAFFIQKSLVYYRQHDCNTAGFLNLDEKKILRGVKVKVLHYKNLAKFSKIYKKNYKCFNELYEKINHEEKFRKKYVEYVYSKYKNRMYLWWEYAKPYKIDKEGNKKHE